LEEHPILEVKDLCTTFHTERGDYQAVSGVSFSVEQGEMLGIVGESGCGKSVTSQSILRLYDEGREVRYSGEILLDGQDILTLSPSEMQKRRGKTVSLVFQDALSTLNPLLTVGYQVYEPLRIHNGMNRQECREAALELLNLVGIPAPEKRLKQYPHELSGGMRQRVMIAIALACRPKLLIADEPTTALDVTIQAQIMELICRLNRQLKMGVILITHDLAVVSETCDRVAVMYLGQIVEEAPVELLFCQPLHPYTQGLIRSIPRLDGVRKSQLHVIEGMVPLLNNIPTGCRFAPRCEYATDRCRAEMPPLTPCGAQKVRCWKVAPEGGSEA
jgi:peptide/nickel transport system ATP-binding protein